MRIISGRLKGKTIFFLKSLITRPLKDSVKENIFNILMHSNKIDINIQNSKILDLYSGVGSFGLECISRGAKKVTFVEKNIDTFKMLKKNLSNLSISNTATTINGEIEKTYNKIFIEKYNIFFLDPPFSDNNFIKNLETIKEEKVFEDLHVVIIHRENKCIDNFENILSPILVKSYGRSKIIFAKFN